MGSGLPKACSCAREKKSCSLFFRGLVFEESRLLNRDTALLEIIGETGSFQHKEVNFLVWYFSITSPVLHSSVCPTEN